MNWSNNIRFSADAYLEPTDIWDVKQVFDNQDVKHMKIAGTKHSFNDIADTDGVQLSLKNFKSIDFDGD